MWPPPAAKLHVLEFHGQPCSRAHIKQSKWPPSAAYLHIDESQGQTWSSVDQLLSGVYRAGLWSLAGKPWSLAHFNALTQPSLAATLHTLPRNRLLRRKPLKCSSSPLLSIRTIESVFDLSSSLLPSRCISSLKSWWMYSNISWINWVERMTEWLLPPCLTLVMIVIRLVVVCYCCICSNGWYN